MTADRFLSAHGRINRKNYALKVVCLLLAILLAQPIILGLPAFTASGQLLDLVLKEGFTNWASAVDASIHAAGNIAIRYCAYFALCLAALFYFMFLTSKRMQNLGTSGAYAWIAAIPFIGPKAVFLVHVLLPGSAGDNRYGVAPLARHISSANVSAGS